MSQRKGRRFTDEFQSEICRVNHAWYGGGLCTKNERRVRRCQRKNSAIKNVSGATTEERNSTVGGGGGEGRAIDAAVDWVDGVCS